MKIDFKLGFLIVFFLLLSSENTFSQIAADAGLDQIICNGQSVVLGGNPTGPSGTSFQWSNSSTLDSSTAANPTASPSITTTYTVTVSDINGRSSTDDVKVTVNTPVDAEAGDDKTICWGESIRIGVPSSASVFSYSWNDTSSLDSSNISNPLAFPQSSTTYVLTLTDSNNCVDVDSVRVSILDTTLTQIGSILTVNTDLDVKVQWLDCDGGDTAIFGETFRTYSATRSGRYAVEIAHDNCVDTSDCVTVTLVGIEQLENTPELRVYSNNQTNNLHIETQFLIQELQIFNSSGILVLRKDRPNQKIDISALPTGIYIIQLNYSEGIHTQKWFKQ